MIKYILPHTDKEKKKTYNYILHRIRKEKLKVLFIKILEPYKILKKKPSFYKTLKNKLQDCCLCDTFHKGIRLHNKYVTVKYNNSITIDIPIDCLDSIVFMKDFSVYNQIETERRNPDG